MYFINKLLSFFFLIFLYIGSFFNKKLNKKWKSRFAFLLYSNSNSKVIDKNVLWFHCASSGEFESVLSILDNARKESAHHIHVSFFSPTGVAKAYEEIKKNTFPNYNVNFDSFGYAPFDIKYDIQKFFSIFPQISSYIVVGRELWPQTLLYAKKKRLARILISDANFKKKSESVWWRLFYSKFFNLFTHICLIDESQKNILLKNNIRSQLFVFGDPRIDRIYHKASFMRSTRIQGNSKNPHIVVFSNLWPYEFKKLQKVIVHLYHAFPHWYFILVPHEPVPHFISIIKNFVVKNNIRFSLLGSLDDIKNLESNISFCHRLMIVTFVGGLFDLYSYSQCAFVGGSLYKKVHNLIEPLAFENYIVTGPKINSFPLSEILKEKELIIEGKNEKKIEDIFINILAMPSSEKSKKYRLDKEKFFLQHKNSGQNIMKLLSTLNSNLILNP